MTKDELIYYTILLIGPALVFLGIILFAKSETKRRETT